MYKSVVKLGSASASFEESGQLAAGTRSHWSLEASSPSAREIQKMQDSLWPVTKLPTTLSIILHSSTLFGHQITGTTQVPDGTCRQVPAGGGNLIINMRLLRTRRLIEVPARFTIAFQPLLAFRELRRRNQRTLEVCFIYITTPKIGVFHLTTS